MDYVSWCGNKPVRRTRVDNPKKGRTREAYNAYMRDYMAAARRIAGIPEQPGAQPRYRDHANDRIDRSNALFDPLRDGWPPPHETIIGYLMGDPPIGRRAIDMSAS